MQQFIESRKIYRFKDTREEKVKYKKWANECAPKGNIAEGENKAKGEGKQKDNKKRTEHRNCRASFKDHWISG